MKYSFLLAFLIVYIAGFSQTIKKKIPYRTIKTIFADLNNDAIIDTIALSSSLNEASSFNKISIKLSGARPQTFFAKDSWTTVDKWFLDANKNAVSTKLLFLKKTDKHTVILLFGVLDGAGYRREFSIINIENNTVKMVFDHTDDGMFDVEHPITLTDLEDNGRLCFVYTQLGEFDGYDADLNGDIGTYVPRFVFPVTDTFKMDKVLTRKYNEDNYVFAGFKYSEKIHILYPRNKKLKPSIYKKKYKTL